MRTTSILKWTAQFTSLYPWDTCWSSSVYCILIYTTVCNTGVLEIWTINGYFCPMIHRLIESESFLRIVKLWQHILIVPMYALWFIPLNNFHWWCHDIMTKWLFFILSCGRFLFGMLMHSLILVIVMELQVAFQIWFLFSLFLLLPFSLPVIWMSSLIYS